HTKRVQWFINRSLKNAGLDYFDLYLVLWPHGVAYDGNESRPENPDSHGQIRLDESGNFNDTWAEMKKVLARGKVKAIGLSNFFIRPKTEHRVNTTGREKELYLGIRVHPYLAQNEAVYCNSIVIYSDRSVGVALTLPWHCEIASHNVATPAQLIISWHVGRSAVEVVTKSTDAGGQKHNYQASLTENYVDATLIFLSRCAYHQRARPICNKPDGFGNVSG
ncbi:Aldo/keto reductase, partial [Suillus hirtellus]